MFLATKELALFFVLSLYFLNAISNVRWNISYNDRKTLIMVPKGIFRLSNHLK